MSSSQFILAYACERKEEMSAEELAIRWNAATRHLEDVAATSLEFSRAGDGRTGFAVWQQARKVMTWPMFAERGGEAAGWLHVPAAAGRPEDGVDAVELARGLSTGAIDRVTMGAPAAAVHWSEDGLRIVNDRLGMVRLYEIVVPGFGMVWSSRPGLAHIFAGLQPALSQSTWNDMATLGWPSHGTAHLGNGGQMPASTSVHAGADGTTSSQCDRDEWIRSIIEDGVPSLAEGGLGMVDSLSTAAWWEGRPVADLSGGKDSRVTAAAAIRAGVVDTVRTVNTDTGEVEAARRLLALAGDPVRHRVDSVVEPKKPEGSAMDRYISMQRAWEGAYNARSAYRSRPFTGFRPASAPRINGLGGEAVQGRTLLNPAWEKKMTDQGAEVGRERLTQMVRSGGGGVGGEVIEDSVASTLRLADQSGEVGLQSAFNVVDFFYHFSKMPYWSMPQATGSTLLPFYAPQMLPRTMWAIPNAMTEYGRLHRDVLRELMPQWADEPFYKGSARTRATPWMWENADWEGIEPLIMEGAAALETFSLQEIENFMGKVRDGGGNGRHETAFARVLWEMSFREYADEIGRQAAATSREVERVRTGN